MKLVEEYDAIQVRTHVLVRWRGKQREALVFGRRDDGLLVVTLIDRRESALTLTIEMTPERYVCSLKTDPAFEAWWVRPDRPGFWGVDDDSPFGMAALAWDAAREHYLECGQMYEEVLAAAVLHGDDSAVPALVDRLVEAGRLPLQAAPGGNGEALRLRKLLEDLCDRWGAGMGGIHEYEEARKFLEKSSDATSRRA